MKNILESLGIVVSQTEDLSIDECNQVITQLVDMRDYIYSVKWKKKFRLDGKIDLALNAEKEAEKIYESFPQEMKR